MVQPTFLVIGAGRSGTTSLHHYLAAHPDVFLPPTKAPSYFYAVDEPAERRRRETDSHFVRTAGEYEALFEPGTGFLARGEVSPVYLAAPRVADRVATELPDIRVIAVLRNPTDRFVARFVARRRDGLERADSIAEVVERERAVGVDLDDTAGTYLAAGFVSHVLDRYIERLGPERVTIHLHDDLKADPAELLARVFATIGVDAEVPVDTSRSYNASGGVIPGPVGTLWRLSAGFRRRIRPLVPERVRNTAFERVTRRVEPFDVAAEDLALLDECYAGEVTKLASLIDRPLDGWTRTSP